MNKKEPNIYLLSFTEEELTQIYESLVLDDELKRRITALHEGKDHEESPLLKKISNQFSTRYAHTLRQGVVENFDEYIDHEVDDEIMWQGIEDELRKQMGPE